MNLGGLYIPQNRARENLVQIMQAELVAAFAWDGWPCGVADARVSFRSVEVCSVPGHPLGFLRYVVVGKKVRLRLVRETVDSGCMCDVAGYLHVS